MGKGSHRRPENRRSVAQNWPFGESAVERRRREREQVETCGPTCDACGCELVKVTASDGAVVWCCPPCEGIVLP